MYHEEPHLEKTKLGCGHQFHKECSDAWGEKKSGCANCRHGDQRRRSSITNSGPDIAIIFEDIVARRTPARTQTEADTTQTATTNTSPPEPADDLPSPPDLARNNISNQDGSRITRSSTRNTNNPLRRPRPSSDNDQEDRTPQRPRYDAAIPSSSGGQAITPGSPNPQAAATASPGGQANASGSPKPQATTPAPHECRMGLGCRHWKRLGCGFVWEGIEKKEIVENATKRSGKFVEMKRTHETDCLKTYGSVCENCHNIFKTEDGHTGTDCIKCPGGCIRSHSCRETNIRVEEKRYIPRICIDEHCTKKSHNRVRNPIIFDVSQL